MAVNRRKRAGQEQADVDYFNVSVWREKGENCAKYLSKGKKVCVTGPVAVETYKRQDGTMGASMRVTADDVEFLTPKGDGGDYQPAAQPEPQAQVDEQSGFLVAETDELPF